MLYILSFLHQTTTFCLFETKIPRLYILSFLHQTTTKQRWNMPNLSCISYLFYIKPQLIDIENKIKRSCISYLFYIKPQRQFRHGTKKPVVYPIFSTSNHNYLPRLQTCRSVVYPIFSTSNHNLDNRCCLLVLLYILSFLHQTTT